MVKEIAVVQYHAIHASLYPESRFRPLSAYLFFTRDRNQQRANVLLIENVAEAKMRPRASKGSVQGPSAMQLSRHSIRTKEAS
jgi:hypothetical protein